MNAFFLITSTTKPFRCFPRRPWSGDERRITLFPLSRRVWQKFFLYKHSFLELPFSKLIINGRTTAERFNNLFFFVKRRIGNIMEWWNKQELSLDFIPDISIPIFHTLIAELSQLYQQIFIAIKRHISHQTAILPATIWGKSIVLWIRERYNLYSFLPSHNKYFKIEILGLGR